MVNDRCSGSPGRCYRNHRHQIGNIRRVDFDTEKGAAADCDAVCVLFDPRTQAGEYLGNFAIALQPVCKTSEGDLSAQRPRTQHKGRVGPVARYRRPSGER